MIALWWGRYWLFKADTVKIMSKVYGATSFSLDSIIITNGELQIEAVKKKVGQGMLRWKGPWQWEGFRINFSLICLAKVEVAHRQCLWKGAAFSVCVCALQRQTGGKSSQVGSLDEPQQSQGPVQLVCCMADPASPFTSLCPAAMQRWDQAPSWALGEGKYATNLNQSKTQPQSSQPFIWRICF